MVAEINRVEQMKTSILQFLKELVLYAICVSLVVAWFSLVLLCNIRLPYDRPNTTQWSEPDEANEIVECQSERQQYYMLTRQRQLDAEREVAR